MTVVTDGRNNNPLPDTYAANAKKDEINAVLEANRYPKDRAVQTYTPVVVNTGTKLVAIDTGLGLGTYNQSKGALGQLTRRIARPLALTPSSSMPSSSRIFTAITSTVCSMPDNKLAFPNAEIMVPEVEWKFWSDESNASRVPEVLKGNFANAHRVFGAFGNKITQYEGGKELVPGITSVFTPGHTPGHMSHLITSGSDRVMVQGDVSAGMAFLSCKIRNGSCNSTLTGRSPCKAAASSTT